MPIQKRSQSLSDLTTQLLATGETDVVDYKKTTKGINSEDLVAFANHQGGNILVGVIEGSENGAQVGRIVGCDVGDGAILEILNKASSCVPPVAVDVFAENLAETPILRVSVSSSETKPHCTPKGMYCRRDGTRTRPLQPQEMLKIFLELESRSFASKFEAAANRISEDLGELESSLESTITRMGDQLGWAEFKLGDTEDTVDRILSLVANVQRVADEANSRLRALLRQDEKSDPVREGYKQKLTSKIIEQIIENPDLLKSVKKGGDLTAERSGIYAIELTKAEFEDAVAAAMNLIREEVERRKYSTSVRKPSDCSDDKIDEFVELVSMGGEVAAGVRDRIMRAKALGFVEYSGAPVGVAAIKRPLKSYKKKVFASSKSELDIDAFSYELGWIYLKENHRGKGLITPLVQEMLETLGAKPIFATTRSSNVVMQQILEHFEFTRSGSPYRSSQKRDESIDLHIKNYDERSND